MRYPIYRYKDPFCHIFSSPYHNVHEFLMCSHFECVCHSRPLLDWKGCIEASRWRAVLIICASPSLSCASHHLFSTYLISHWVEKFLICAKYSTLRITLFLLQNTKSVFFIVKTSEKWRILLGIS